MGPPCPSGERNLGCVEGGGPRGQGLVAAEELRVESGVKACMRALIRGLESPGEVGGDSLDGEIHQVLQSQPARRLGPCPGGLGP